MAYASKVIRIPQTNPISFIWDNDPTKNYETYNGNFFSRMLQIWDMQGQAFYQPFETGGYLGVQIQCGGNYPFIDAGGGFTFTYANLQLLDCRGIVLNEESFTFDNTVVGNTAWMDGVEYQLTTYNWKTSFLNLGVANDDIYFLRIKIGAGSNLYDTFTSEPIDVRASHPGTRLLEYLSYKNTPELQTDWTGGGTAMYFHMPVYGDLVMKAVGNERAQYDDQGMNPRQQTADPYRIWTLKMGYPKGMPASMYDKINHAASCDLLIIDKTRYVAKNTVEIGAQIPRYKMYAGSLELHEYDKDSINIKGGRSPLLLFTFTVPMYLYSGSVSNGSVTVGYFSALEINDSAGIDTAVSIFNSISGGGALTGVFTRVGDSVYYTSGTGENFTTANSTIFTKKLTFAYFKSGSGATPYISLFAKRAAVVYDSPTQGYNMGSASGAAPFVTHTYNVPYSSSGLKLLRLWHDDNIQSLSEGVPGQAKGAGSLIEIYGDAPAGIKTLQVSNIMAPTFDLSIWPTSLQTIIVNFSTILTNILGFNKNWSNLSTINFDRAVIPTANIDLLFNTFVATTPTTVNNGVFRTVGQTPAAPPTTASAASRLTLFLDGWNNITD